MYKVLRQCVSDRGVEYSPEEQITELRNRSMHTEMLDVSHKAGINQQQKGSAGTTGYQHEKRKWN